MKLLTRKAAEEALERLNEKDPGGTDAVLAMVAVLTRAKMALSLVAPGARVSPGDLVHAAGLLIDAEVYAPQRPQAPPPLPAMEEEEAAGLPFDPDEHPDRISDGIARNDELLGEGETHVILNVAPFTEPLLGPDDFYISWREQCDNPECDEHRPADGSKTAAKEHVTMLLQATDTLSPTVRREMLRIVRARDTSITYIPGGIVVRTGPLKH